MNQLDYEVLHPIHASKKRIAETEAQEQAVIQDMMATYEEISGSASAAQCNF